MAQVTVDKYGNSLEIALTNRKSGSGGGLVSSSLLVKQGVHGSSLGLGTMISELWSSPASQSLLIEVLKRRKSSK